MALQVWLPLNGNLKNNGVAELTVTGTPSYINGKMGKSLSLASKVTFNGLPKLVQFSIAFWAKVDSCTVDWADLVGFTSKQSDGTAAASFRFEATISTRACSFHNNSPYAITQASEVLITEAQKGTWHHCCFVYSGAQCFIYVDGVHKYTHTGLNGYLIDEFHIGETGNMVGGLNDLRIYDECLSLKQVKELAKGLVAHFPLKGTGRPNLLGLDFVASGWSKNGSTATASYTEDEMTITYGIDSPNTHTGMYKGIQGYLTAGTTYTLSYDLKASKNFTVRAGFEAVATTCSVTTDWKRFRTKYTCPATVPSWLAFIVYTGEADTATIRTGDYVKIRNIKLEVGEDDTPWLLKSTDARYSMQNYLQDYGIDCSGCGNNGIATGTINYRSDSPRYSNGAGFNTTGYIHNIPSCLNTGTDSFSIAFWFRLTGTSNGAFYNNRTTVGEGVSVFLLNANKLRFDTGASYQWQPNITVNTNQWYHLCVTRDATGKKVYLDGVLKDSTTGAGVLTTTSTVSSIGVSSSGTAYGGNELPGDMSDFRIYSTVLSADDVLELYKTAGMVDNEGTVYSYEFTEED